MPKIVKLSELSKKEREEIEDRIRKDTEQIKEVYKNMSSNNKTNNLQLPIANTTTNKTTTKLPIANTTSNNDNKAWYKKIFQKPQAFDDGYQFGDVTKTIGGTLLDAGTGLAKGAIGLGEGIGKVLSYGVAQIADWTGNDEKADKLRNKIANEPSPLTGRITEWQKKNVEPYSILGDTSDSASEGIGQVLALGGAGKVVGGATKGAKAIKAAETARNATMFASAAGHSLADSYKNEDIEDWQAWTRALGTGYLAYKIESLGGIFSKGGADKAVTEAITGNMKSSFAKIATRVLGTGFAEGGEEALEYVANQVLDRGIDVANKMISNNKATLSEDWDWDEFWTGIFAGTVAGTSMGAGQTLARGANIKSQNPNMNLKQVADQISYEQKIESKLEVLEEEKASLEKELGSKKLTRTEINEIFTEMQQVDKQIETLKKTFNTENVQNKVQTQQNNTAKKTNIEQIKIDTDNFTKQIEAVKNGTFPKNDMLVLGKTPQVLKDIGLPDLPITMTQKHLDTIMNESGKHKGANYHGLGEDIIKQLPEAINNPLDIVKSNTKDDSIVLTTYLADKNDNTVIASIKINGQGSIDNIRIDTNVMTSAYGKSNYDNFMKKNLEEGNLLYDIDRGVIKKVTGARLQLPRRSNSNIIANNNDISINNSISQLTKNVKDNSIINNNSMQNSKKNTLNPTEISGLNARDASTTPNLPPRNYARGNKESSFLSNITTDAGFLNEDLRHEMAKEDNIRYYKGITNQETLEKAYNSLNKDGENATLNWFNKENKNVTAEDVAKGWILLKQYQDAGDYQSAVEVAKKMREMGTSAGQATQAYNILSRLTPEGMFYYAQSELTEAYNQMVKGKSKEWIDKNASKFDLTAEETQIIMDTMQDVSTMEDGYEKKVKIAEIQKLISDKIPPTAGQSIKAWMRISMLFNTKTQVRNILGNAVILPVNMTSDFISSNIDKAISKKTGVRTTGNTNLKSYGKGFKKGLYESYNDFRKGINTRNIEGNRFEVSEGKSFKGSGIGKALNRVDNILSFALDGGDRGFYEATFTNSINNQLVLNNTTEVTQEMIDIATNEALQRTWQDNNAYTSAVLGIRNILNGKIDFAGIHTKGLPYGLGDILIPFAKTPANLTKAIVDYSPVGLVKAITLDARTFKNSLENGQYTPQMQHKLVQNIGKGLAGSFLYVLGYALAKAGIASGEADDDKDVKNFMKNSLGISSYSIKIGNKTFTYDWAQPVATPLAIMTNYVKYSKDNPDANIIERAIKSLNIGTEQLLEQSFMQTLNTVLNGNGTTLENLTQAVLELPARAIPTFSKYIADMVDGTQRTSFEYDKPLKSAVNAVVAKIPFASKALPVSRDTLGNEIEKYGGENNIFNVMFNPANVNKGKLSKAGEEIYRLYQETGETSVFPITAPYYINSKGEKITMTAEERSNYQKVAGEYTEKAINELLSNSAYKKLTDEKKAELIKEIISDSNAKAKYDILKIETEDAKKKRELIEKAGTKSYYDYKFKTKDLEKEIEKVEVLANANYSNKVKETIYESTIGKDDSLYSIMKETNINTTEYLKYKSQKFESDQKDDGTTNGKTISGSKKEKVYEYVNNMDITYNQKLLLLGTQYSLTSAEKTKLAHYINDMNISKKRKMEIYDKISGFTVYKDGRIKW